MLTRDLLDKLLGKKYKVEKIALVDQCQMVKTEYINQLHSIRPDLSLEYIERILIDKNQYYKDFNDVKLANCDALGHYLLFGCKEGRAVKSGGLLRKNIDFKIPYNRIVYYSNYSSPDGSFKYRCEFQSINKNNVLVYNGRTLLTKLIPSIFRSSKIIFSRPEDAYQSSFVLNLCRNIGVHIQLDYDDLLLPETANYLGHVRSGFNNITAARKNMLKKSSFFMYADSFSCSTHSVAKNLVHFNSDVRIVRNQIPKSYIIDDSKVTQKIMDRDENRIKIIYLSGTSTHRRDYSIIHGVLLKLAQLYGDNFDLTFLGRFEYDVKPFKQYLLSVEVIEKVSFTEMLNVISRHDLAVVPLEDTVFNNAKSCIKYIECGSQGVPIIASSVNEFRLAITDCVDGWLCGDQNEWFERLEMIISNPMVLNNVSHQVRHNVLAHHTLG